MEPDDANFQRFNYLKHLNSWEYSRDSRLLLFAPADPFDSVGVATSTPDSEQVCWVELSWPLSFSNTEKTNNNTFLDKLHL